MKFFEFNQNNSGGSFECNKYLTHRVLIEADTAEEATEKAEALGMYWDGVSCEMDCDCCGDRWSKPYGDGMKFPYQYGSFKVKEAESIAEKYDGEAVPSKFGNREDRMDVVFRTVENYSQYMADVFGWLDPDVYVYFKDGRKLSFTGKVREKRR